MALEPSFQGLSRRPVPRHSRASAKLRRRLRPVKDILGCQSAAYEWAESYDTKDWARLLSCTAPTLRVGYPFQYTDVSFHPTHPDSLRHTG